ncbi:MAG: DUF4097 family beta strand repeat-containing protein [Spirochaetales bacterium]|nr:DUF4097 family beta strand repeat-containing protein [Spirochaetales bacterium]
MNAKKLFCTFAALSLFGALFAAQNLAKQEIFSEAEVLNLNINLGSEDLKIEKCTNSEITVEVYTNNKNRIPDISLNKNCLTIIKQKYNISKPGEYCNLVVYIPENKKFETLEVSTSSGELTADQLIAQTAVISASSGDITLTDCSFEQSNVDTSSGDISIKTITSKKLKTKTSSGRIKFGTITCDSFSVHASSGNISVEKIECETFSAETSSGDITFDKVTADYFDAEASSGDIKLGLEKVPEASSSLKTSSGEQSVFVPKEQGFSLKVSTTSGTFKDRIENNRFSPRGHYTNNYNGGGAQLSLTSTSGDIELW